MSSVQVYIREYIAHLKLDKKGLEVALIDNEHIYIYAHINTPYQGWENSLTFFIHVQRTVIRSHLRLKTSTTVDVHSGESKGSLRNF